MNNLEKKETNDIAISEKDIAYLKKYLGHNGKDGNISDSAIKALYTISKKYNLDPFAGEIAILYDRPYIQYRGLMKILIDTGIDFQINFNILKDDDKEIAIECLLFITPKGFTNRTEYYIKMKQAGFTLEEAKKDAITTGYARIEKAKLSTILKNYYILAAKKQAFKDAFNFSTIAQTIGEAIPIDLDIEVEAETEPEVKNVKPVYKVKKEKDIDDEELKKQAHQTFGRIRKMLIEYDKTSEDFRKILALRDAEFDAKLFKFIQKKMNVKKSTLNKASSIQAIAYEFEQNIQLYWEVCENWFDTYQKNIQAEAENSIQEEK